MANEIVKFEDQVRERIKAIVGELIPDAKWQAIVNQTITQFELIDLPKLVKDELTEEYKKQIKAEFSKPEWQNKYGINGNAAASEMVTKIIVEAAPQILSGIIGNVVQQTIYDINSRITVRY